MIREGRKLIPTTVDAVAGDFPPAEGLDRALLYLISTELTAWSPEVLQSGLRLAKSLRKAKLSRDERALARAWGKFLEGD